jgi:hypothetical protein
VVYLADMSTKAEMDEVWCDWIPDGGWPCRACVAVDLAPGDLVEIKVTAIDGRNGSPAGRTTGSGGGLKVPASDCKISVLYAYVS